MLADGMLSLAQPGWLWLLPLLAAGAWKMRRGPWGGDDEGSSLLLIHPDLTPLAEAGSRPAKGARGWLPILACALLIAALAQPRWIGEWIPAAPEGREIVLLIDTSRTMSINDFADEQGRPVERLEVLKGIVSRFIAARRGDRFGAIAFGSYAATLAPPSFDPNLAIGMIRRVQVGVAGDNTALGDAIGLALKQLQAQPKLRPALILFSDGADSNTGELTPLEAVELARRAGVPVYTVQIGSDLFAAGRAAAADAPAEVQPGLREIAERSGGRYYVAADGTALHAVVEAIGQREKTVARPSTQRHIREWYLAPLLAAAFLFSLDALLRLRRQMP
ncbi:MAG: VWA domain-containing protein [Burkholderiales bacterium]